MLWLGQSHSEIVCPDAPRGPPGFESELIAAGAVTGTYKKCIFYSFPAGMYTHS